ncbi:unnamed protein product [Parajaminaea phylloscopi]
MAAANDSLSEGSEDGLSPPKDTSVAQGGARAGTGHAAGSAVQSRARSSYASLQDLRRELVMLLAQGNIQLAPNLSNTLAFTRNQLRNAYLRLLFYAPFTKSAHHAEQGMWSDTTHRVVAVYRSRLSKLEKLLKSETEASNSASADATPARGKVAKQQGESAHSAATKRGAALEYSRMAEAFRSFLAKEEAFWKALAERLTIVFGLRETHVPILRAGLDGSDPDPRIPTGPKALSGLQTKHDSGPAGLARLPAIPDELDASVLAALSQPRHKDRLVEVVFKILVYCGDLARYREIYRDTSLSGPRQGGAPSGRGYRRSSPAASGQRRSATPAPRNFLNAVRCYEAARLLSPSEGNPSNQLAVVATYQSDTFGALYHYYRALCVRRPFVTAKINLGSVLIKAVDAWEKDGAVTTAAERQPVLGDELRQRCYDDFVVLHGLFFTRRNPASVQPLAACFLTCFEHAVSNKVLPTDNIVRIVITALAASWSARLWRRSADVASAGGRTSLTLESNQGTADGAQSDRTVEVQLLSHVVGIAQALLSVFHRETQQVLQADALSAASSRSKQQQVTEGLASKLTMVTRRILPALRVLTKWMKAHLDYIDRSEGASIARAAEGYKATEAEPTNGEQGGAKEDSSAARLSADLALVQSLESLWTSYVECINTMRYGFPFDALPRLSTMGATGKTYLSLEEDVDLRGFIPTRKGMLTQDDADALNPAGESTGSGDAKSKIHPNEEQLMRIADLLIDAKIIAESEASPILFDDESSVFRLDPSAKARQKTERAAAPITRAGPKGQEPAAAKASGGVAIPESSRPVTAQRGIHRKDSDGNLSGGTSEATEDVVDLAMRAVAGRPDSSPSDELSDDDEDDDEDEDEILLPSSVRRERKMKSKSAADIDGPSATPTSIAHDFAGATTFDTRVMTDSLPPSRQSVGRLEQAPIGTPSLASGQTNITAQDLLLQMINGRSGHAVHAAASPQVIASHGHERAPQSTPFVNQASNAHGGAMTPVQQSMRSVNHDAAPQSAQLAQLASIWGTTPTQSPGSATPLPRNSLSNPMIAHSPSASAGMPASMTMSNNIWNQLQASSPMPPHAFGFAGHAVAGHPQQPAFDTNGQSQSPIPDQYRDYPIGPTTRQAPDVWGRPQQHQYR